jgi:hypothetical protein
MQISRDEYCGCGSGLKKLLCVNCPTGTSLCPCYPPKPYYDCGTCNGKGKVVNRGKTCWAHDKLRRDCKSCAKAELSDKKTRFFGIKERALIANGELAVPKFE